MELEELQYITGHWEDRCGSSYHVALDDTGHSCSVTTRRANGETRCTRQLIRYEDGNIVWGRNYRLRGSAQDAAEIHWISSTPHRDKRLPFVWSRPNLQKHKEVSAASQSGKPAAAAWHQEWETDRNWPSDHSVDREHDPHMAQNHADAAYQQSLWSVAWYSAGAQYEWHEGASWPAWPQYQDVHSMLLPPPPPPDTAYDIPELPPITMSQEPGLLSLEAYSIGTSSSSQKSEEAASQGNTPAQRNSPLSSPRPSLVVEASSAPDDVMTETPSTQIISTSHSSQDTNTVPSKFEVGDRVYAYFYGQWHPATIRKTDIDGEGFVQVLWDSEFSVSVLPSDCIAPMPAERNDVDNELSAQHVTAEADNSRPAGFSLPACVDDELPPPPPPPLPCQGLSPKFTQSLGSSDDQRSTGASSSAANHSVCSDSALPPPPPPPIRSLSPKVNSPPATCSRISHVGNEFSGPSSGSAVHVQSWQHRSAVPTDAGRLPRAGADLEDLDLDMSCVKIVAKSVKEESKTSPSSKDVVHDDSRKRRMTHAERKAAKTAQAAKTTTVLNSTPAMSKSERKRVAKQHFEDELLRATSRPQSQHLEYTSCRRRVVRPHAKTAAAKKSKLHNRRQKKSAVGDDETTKPVAVVERDDFEQCQFCGRAVCSEDQERDGAHLQVCGKHLRELVSREQRLRKWAMQAMTSKVNALHALSSPHALEWQSTFYSQFEKLDALVDLLLEHGEDLDDEDEHGETPLDNAIALVVQGVADACGKVKKNDLRTSANALKNCAADASGARNLAAVLAWHWAEGRGHVDPQSEELCEVLVDLYDEMKGAGTDNDTIDESEDEEFDV